MDDFDLLFHEVNSLTRFCFQDCEKLVCPQNCLPCSIRIRIKDIENIMSLIVEDDFFGSV